MSLAQETQIRSLVDLVGHTIKAVIQSPNGIRSASLVIVTETGCWLALDADEDGLEVDRADIPLSQYLSAIDAYRAGLVNLPTYHLLRQKEEEVEAKQNKVKAAVLRKQLADLEAKASARLGGVEEVEASW